MQDLVAQQYILTSHRGGDIYRRVMNGYLDPPDTFHPMFWDKTTIFTHQVKSSLYNYTMSFAEDILIPIQSCILY